MNNIDAARGYQHFNPSGTNSIVDSTETSPTSTPTHQVALVSNPPGGIGSQGNPKSINLLPVVPNQQSSRTLTEREKQECQVIGKSCRRANTSRVWPRYINVPHVTSESAHCFRPENTEINGEFAGVWNFMNFVFKWKLQSELNRRIPLVHELNKYWRWYDKMN